jgi:hypothetical protein
MEVFERGDIHLLLGWVLFVGSSYMFFRIRRCVMHKKNRCDKDNNKKRRSLFDDL